MSTDTAGGLDARPASASTMAIVGVVGLLTLVVALVTRPIPVLLGAASAAGLGYGVHVVRDDRPTRVALGTVAGLVAMCTAVVAPLLSGASAAWATLAVEVAVFGATTARYDATGDGAVTDAIGMLSYAVVAVWLTSLLLAMLPAFVWVVEGTLRTFVPANAGPDLFGFAVLLTLAVASVRSALRGLPIAELAPREDRDDVRGLLDQTEGALSKALVVSVVGIGVGVVTTVVLLEVSVPPAVVALISIPAGTPILRGPLFAVAVLAGAIAVGARLVRWTGGTILERARRGAAVGAGVGFTLVLALATPLIVAVVEWVVAGSGVVSMDSHLQMVSVLFAVDSLLITTLSLLMLVPAIVALNLAPERAAGRAMGAAGLVLAAMAVATVVDPLVTLALTVGAVVVWDVGEFAIGLGEEVGRAVDTGRTETIHTAGSVGVGAVALVVAGLSYGLVQVLNASGRVALLALAASVLGTFLLVAALRG